MWQPRNVHYSVRMPGIEPAPDLEQASLEELLFRLTRQLRSRWREGLDATHADLSPHDARALMVIGRHAPVRPGVVAEHLHIAARSATDVIDRLEERMLVTRSPDPGDRRATVIDLTAVGRQLASAVRAQRSKAAAEHFAALSPIEQAQLGTLLRKALAHTDET